MNQKRVGGRGGAGAVGAWGPGWPGLAAGAMWGPRFWLILIVFWLFWGLPGKLQNVAKKIQKVTKDLQTIILVKS